MKKYLTVAAAGFLLIATPSFANNTQKINFVKRVYAPYSAANDYGRNDNDLHIITRYADFDLKRLILQDGYESQVSKGLVCIEGDIIMYAQDWDRPRFSYGVDKKGLVVVNIKDPTMFNYTKQVKYKLSGSPGNYKISDIIYRSGSFKQELKECLDRYSRMYK